MKTVEAQGYSKEKAFETTNLDVELGMLKNATLAWKKAGSPFNAKEMNRFMSEYLKKNKAVGAYLVIEPSSDDTRLRPYSVINETTKGKRKAKTTYQIKTAELKVRYSTVLDEEGNPFTAHTTNDVPLIVTNSHLELKEGGKLGDLAPTMLQLLGLAIPEEMDGTSLIK